MITSEDYALPFPLQRASLSHRAQIDKEGIVSLHGEDGSVHLVPRFLDWDSNHLGYPVYRMISVLRCVPDGTSVMCTLPEWLAAKEAPVLLWARLASTSTEAVRILEENGFRYVSSLSTFLWNASSMTPSTDSRIRKATESDVNGIRSIGGSAFIHDRLHQDPAIPAAIAGRMYSDWSCNCLLRDLCDEVLVIEDGATVAGFVSLKKDTMFSQLFPNGLMRIILIAVAEEYRRKGFGRLLVEAAKNYTLRCGCERLIVGTGSDNIPAQTLYAKCGCLPFHTDISLEKRVEK